MVKLLKNYDELEKVTITYALTAITKFSLVRRKAIRNRVAYPSSDLTPAYKLDKLSDEEKDLVWEKKLAKNPRFKQYKKKRFFLASAYFLDFLRFFMVRGSKSTFSSSLIFLETSVVKAPLFWNKVLKTSKLVTSTTPIWLALNSIAFRTKGTRRIRIKIPPQKKSSDPIYTSEERKATGAFGETVHLLEELESKNYDLISESFRNFYQGSLTEVYKTYTINIPRLLSLKSTKPVLFRKLDRKSFSKKEKTGKLLVTTLYRYYFLFFSWKKTASWAVIASLAKTKNLRAFRINLKFWRTFDKDLKNYYKGQKKTHNFKISPFLLTRFYSGRKKAKLRRIGLIKAYKKTYDLLFQGNRNFKRIGKLSKKALLCFTRRGQLRKANVIPRDLGIYYKDASYYMNQCLVRYQIRMHRALRPEGAFNLFRGKLFFLQPWLIQCNPSLVLYSAVVSLESRILALKKLFRFNTLLINSFRFFFAGKKRVQLFLNFDFYPKKRSFFRNYKPPIYTRFKLYRKFRNWSPKRSSRLGYRTLSRKGTTQLLILDYLNFKKKIFKHPEPTRIFIRHHSRINKSWLFRDLIFVGNLSFEEEGNLSFEEEGNLSFEEEGNLSKLTEVFLKKTRGNYKPSFRFQKWKKPLNHRIEQLTLNLNGESNIHFASTSDYKTIKQSLGRVRPPVKKGLLPFSPKILYPYNNKKRTKKPAVKVSAAKLSKATPYVNMLYNSIVEEGLANPRALLTLHTLQNNPGFREYKPTNFRLNFFKKTYHVIDWYFPQEQLKNISSIFATYSQSMFFFKSFILPGILAKPVSRLDYFTFGFFSKEASFSKKILKKHPKFLKFRKEPRFYRKAKDLVALRPFGLDVPEPATLTANWEDYENLHISKFRPIRDKDGKLTRDTLIRIKQLTRKAKKLILNARP